MTPADELAYLDDAARVLAENVEPATWRTFVVVLARPSAAKMHRKILREGGTLLPDGTALQLSPIEVLREVGVTAAGDGRPHALLCAGTVYQVRVFDQPGPRSVATR